MKRYTKIVLILLSVFLAIAFFQEIILPGNRGQIENTERKRIISDYDPGHFNEDDFALALALASPELDVVGITVERSFAGAEKTPLKMLHRIGRVTHPWPSARPLLRDRERSNCVRTGDTGWAEGNASGRMPVPMGCGLHGDLRHRAECSGVYSRKAREERITIITAGPLTNPAEAISEHPEIIPNIDEIMIMGGSIYREYDGNNDPEPEWNMRSDVESARIVFSSRIPIYLIPLDVTWDLKLWKNERDLIKNARNPLTDTLWEPYRPL